MKPALLTLFLLLTALPALAAPAPFTMSASSQCNGATPHIFLTWGASSGAISYDVIRNSVDIVTVTSGTAYDDANVVPSVSYSYFIRATDGSSTTDSNTVVVSALSCSPPPGPFALSGNAYCYNAEQRTAAIHLSWPSSSNATSYDVYRDGGVIGSIPSGGSWSFDDLGPYSTAPRTLSYYVVAKNPAGTTQSNTVVVQIQPDVCQAPPSAPALDGSASCDTTGPRAVVSLTWSAATGAAGYQVIRNNAPLAGTSGTTYTDTTVNAGQSYAYKIIATNSGGSTDSNTKIIDIPSAICPPSTPTASATPTCVAGPPAAPAVRVTWTTAAFATSYVVNRGGTPISGSLPADATSFDDVNVTAGQTYSYTVTASNTSGSATSPAAQATVANLPCIPNPPGQFSAAANAGCDGNVAVVHVSWTTSTGAASYVVKRDGSAISGTLPASTANFNDTNVPAGHSYTYTVTASNGSGTATTSSPASVSVSSCGSPPQQPPGTFTASSSTFCNSGAAAVRVTWTTAAGATSYVVNRNGTSVSGSLGSTATSFDDSTVIAGQTYSYDVVASNSGGSRSAAAGTIGPSAAVCPPPSFTLTATTSCSPIASPPLPVVTLNWSAAATATSYLILRSGVQIGSVGGNTTSFDDAGTTRGLAYDYVVRAIGPGGATDSNRVTVVIDPTACQLPCAYSCAASVAVTAAVLTPVRFALQLPDTCGLEVTWNFGDGSISHDLAPSHSYPATGQFHWSVTIGNESQGMCQNGATITVTGMTAPPKRRAVRH
jgi:fibronectin type 3 domain-containing protein